MDQAKLRGADANHDPKELPRHARDGSGRIDPEAGAKVFRGCEYCDRPPKIDCPPTPFRQFEIAGESPESVS